MKKILFRFMAVLLVFGMMKDPFLLVASAMEDSTNDASLIEETLDEDSLNEESEEEVVVEEAIAPEIKSEEEESVSFEMDDSDDSSLTVMEENSFDIEEFKQKVSMKQLEFATIQEQIANKISEELAFGNKPVVSMNEVDILVIFEEVLAHLNSLITEVSMENYLAFCDQLDEQVLKFETASTYFYEHNLSLSELGLFEKHEDLSHRYLDLSKSREDYLMMHGISSIEEVSHMDLELVSFYQELAALTCDYDSYKKEEEAYLMRRPSDRNLFDDETLEEMLLTYNKDQAVLEILSILDHEWMKEEVSYYDLILALHFGEDLDQTIQKKKIEFYQISFLENPYDLTIQNNRIVASQNITKDELLSYVVSIGHCDVLEENGLVLVVLDEKQVEVLRYLVVLKNDWNEDGVLDEKDKRLFAEAIVGKKEDTRYDLNQDGVVDYDDFLMFEKENEEGSSTTFQWASYEENGKMYYELRMENGLLASFYLSLLPNENLEFEEILGCKEVILDQKNPNVLLGYDLTSSTVTLVYRIKNKMLDRSMSIETLANDKVDIYHQVFPGEKEVVKPQENSSVVPTSYTHEVFSDVREETVSKKEDEKPKEEVDTQKQDKTLNEVKKEEAKTTTWNIIKIVVIVFLGAVIVYLMNKKEIQGEFLEDEKKEDSHSKE